MRFCDHCLAPLSQEATHCPECGLPVTSGTDDPLLLEEAERLVNPRLAQANLLRLRGQWDEAIRACAEVLRQFPSNVHAHALMGDIYRDQGNLEEAAQWYKLALDLAPDSVVDRQRLEQVQRELELRQQARHQSQEVQHLQKQARNLRIFSASVIGAAVVIAIGITWAFQSRIASNTTPLSITTSRLSTEASTMASLPTPEGNSTVIPTPNPPEPQTTSSPHEPKPKAEAAVHTEDDLLAEKVREWLRQHRVAPDLLTVVTDPVANHLLVTFGYHSEVSRDTLYRTAWLSAAAAFAVQPSIETVRVRCLVPVNTPAAEKLLVLGFSVDLHRKAMPPQPAETPLQDILKFFEQVYSNPEVGIPSP
ncbi:MAG: tetratricopeptide repeat protein [Armatimonadota bacterium]|nr:tetratricopeptide repeat protein [bacterium]MCS7309653.1 tetratricopeptide repeat protein [Armatimonadota bacterium]MDW8290885.1 tetratricopeptide repeat protein [Armatimonadota bacterium]